MSGRMRSAWLGVATLIPLVYAHGSLTEPIRVRESPAKPFARQAPKADIRSAETHMFAAAAFRSFGIAY